MPLDAGLVGERGRLDTTVSIKETGATDLSPDQTTADGGSDAGLGEATAPAADAQLPADSFAPDGLKSDGKAADAGIMDSQMDALGQAD